MAEYQKDLKDSYGNVVHVELDGTIDLRVTFDDGVPTGRWAYLSPEQSRKLRKALKRAEKAERDNS